MQRGRVCNIETELAAIGLSQENGEVVVMLVKQNETRRLVCGTDGRFEVNDYAYRVGEKTLNIQAALIGEWLDEQTFYFEFRPLSNDIWAIYSLTFTDDDEIELRIFVDA